LSEGGRKEKKEKKKRMVTKRIGEAMGHIGEENGMGYFLIFLFKLFWKN